MADPVSAATLCHTATSRKLVDCMLAAGQVSAKACVAVLFECIRHGCASTVNAAIAAGADVNARENGLTPLDEAVRCDEFKMFRLLLQHGAIYHSTNDSSDASKDPEPTNKRKAVELAPHQGEPCKVARSADVVVVVGPAIGSTPVKRTKQAARMITPPISDRPLW